MSHLNSLAQLIFEYAYSQPLSSDTFHSFLRSKLPEIARGVAELSALYTRGRQDLSRDLLKRPLLRKAYLTYFLPCNLSKTKRIFQEIRAHPKSSEWLRGNLRLLDVGCGPGTNLLGFLDFLVEQPQDIQSLDCVAVDSLKANLQDAQHLFENYLHLMDSSARPRHCSLQTQSTEITRPLQLESKQTFDFIIFGNVLNELFLALENRIEKRYEVVSSIAAQYLAPSGFLILIEPALKETSRELLFLRDLLLDRSDLRVYSPCVHSLHCPAVARESLMDWCHEDRSWAPPFFIQMIDSRVGNRKTSLKYSYAILNRMGFSVREAGLWQFQKEAFRNGSHQTDSGTEALMSPMDSLVWRVVSERIREKGKSSVYLCGSEGRTKVTCLKRHRSSANEDFKRLDRGRVVMTRGMKKKNDKDWRVEAETQVKCLI